MRVTVCELPHEATALATVWKALVQHTQEQRPDLLVLPEFAFAEPVWEYPTFDAARWQAAEDATARWLQRLPELGVPRVIGARPVTIGGRPLNQGFLWSHDAPLQALRSKYYLPDEPGGREARWFDRGDAAFPAFTAGALKFGLSICTELWALENYATYAQGGVQAIVSPRATARATTAKWLAVGTVAAVRSGAYSLSSNRSGGDYGGAGWVISPDGELLARTSAEQPAATVTIDPVAATAARQSYPRNVFAAR